MLKDRIVEIGGAKRVLLPERCAGPSESYSVKQLCAILASDRHSVLITGETGTGKEMLADCVMQMTKRPKGKCQRLNCAGLDSNLVGSELFGHKKGAFTGAEKDREGLLRACDGGVLFLDEIGWLLPDLQARLLRFMETGEIRPIGADRIEHHADVRIVAATNKDVKEALIHDLRARFDFEVNLPPLRERAGDILWFVCEPAFLGAEEVFTGITLRTLVGMFTHKWSGNFRELKNYCQRKVVLRPVEELNGAEPHVLDDWTLAGDATLDLWSQFAGFALDAIESYAAKKAVFLDEAGTQRTLALLVGLFRGIKRMDWVYGEKGFVATVPVRVLRSAVAGQIAGLNEFNLKATVSQPINAAHKRLGLCVDTHIEQGPEAEVLDLGGAFVILSRFAEAFDAVNADIREHVCDIDGQLRRVPVTPSLSFVNQVGRAGPEGIFGASPSPPTGGDVLHQILDALGIRNEPDCSIALLCNRGLSNKEISRRVSLKPTTVGEHLMKLRRIEKLKNFLPKHPAGRKASKRPD